LKLRIKVRNAGPCTIFLKLGKDFEFSFTLIIQI